MRQWLIKLFSRHVGVGRGPRTPYPINWEDLDDVKRYADELATSGRAMAVVKLKGAKGYRVYPAETAVKMRNAEVVYYSVIK